MHRVKKYLPFIIGGVVLLVVAIGLFVWYNWQTPEKVLNRYIQYVNEGRYEDMYELLSEKAKGYTDRQAFLDQNKNIYEGIEASNVKISNIIKSDESTDNYTYLEYDYEMDTVAGHYRGGTSARITKKPNGWAIDWNEGMIIPSLSKGQTVSVVPVTAERGSIYDRNGNLLAGKGQVLEIGIVPEKLSAETKDADLQSMAALLGMKTEAIQSKLSQSWVTDDVRVPMANINMADTALEAQLLAIPGVYTDTAEVRTYPYGEKASQLTGYVQGISAEELETRGDEGYTESSVIGKSGLEAAYESRLRGKDGCKIQVDKGGFDNYQDEAGNWTQKPRIWTLVEDKAEKGEDVTVTIDASLQTRLYDQFASDKSSSVAINPKTGEVLALVSTPSFDANAFISGFSEEAWNALSTDPSMPLQNRFEAAYAPGSSFKPLTAGVGMTSGNLDPAADFGASGTSWQKDASWGGLMITTLQAYDGPANLENALVYSDNIYFAKAALQMGGTAFKEGLEKSGFGKVLDFPLALSPSQVSNSGDFANEGQLAQSGYGQGEVLVNPVHMASVYSAFVNEGSMIKPVLEYSGTPQFWYRDVFSSAAADTIRNDLIQVVENPAGTAHEAYIDGVTLAGKTGTAEIKASQDDTGGTEIGWFNAFTADPDSPDPLLVVSMVEDVKDRGGSHYLVPKVRSVF
ncbi:penicillin-binding transpeptidase domain-containing protein [Eubacterium sp. 1001713B170207_170306_E7]|uniref:penicillin-binding transpeptidase domain-containing protein n=1 Tax=Eubacterium sp. 1001713B170207_170306_E7 TaxID=2787097 RepID=UPI0018990D8E|nr:penicillin-binding transpeptidase domain-containing protein [Eubacterium sp. 1001713B170207_170306_E7]